MIPEYRLFMNGIDAIRSFTECKSIWIELTGATRDPFVLG